ncbi:MAG: PAS domain S-box protein [Flavobacteriales bacterium]|nr:PAS domain S-box protein [Flavobacteriales bacterium]
MQIRKVKVKNEIELDAFRAFMNISPDFAFLSRIDNFQFAEVNDLACKEYGYTRKEFLSMQIFDIEVKPLIKKEVRTFYDVTPVGKVMSLTGINKRKDGSTFPVEVRFSKINDTYALAHVRDISEQLLSLERNELLAQMTKDSSTAMLTLDLKLNIVQWNKGCERLFGYTADEVIDNQNISLLRAQDRSSIKKFLGDLVAECETKSIETIRIHKSGKQIEINATYWVTRDEDGVVNGISGIMRDISKEKLTHKIQDALVNIAQASVRRIIDTKWFCKFVHEELTKIMDVRHFYIILYDRKTASYNFPILKGCQGLRSASKSNLVKNTLFAHVIQSGQPFFEQKSELLRVIKSHKIQMETEVPEVYIAVPLKSEGKVIGVMAAQSFENPFAYSIKNMIALELVSKLISNIMTRDLIINELMASEEHYRSLSEKSGDVISVLDKKMIIQYESYAAKHVFGKDPHKLLGHSFLKDVHPDDEKMIRKCLRSVSRVTNKTVIESCRYRHGNGSWVRAELRIKNLLKDKVVNGILIHKTDITKSHKAQEAVKASERKFKTVVTQSLEAIYFVNPNSLKVLEANQSFLDYTGYSQKDIGKIALKDFVQHSTKDIKTLARQVLKGEPIKNIERIWHTKSGDELSVLISASKITVGIKEVIVVTARDISPQKKTEEDLIKINQELDTFVYKASHDLRGPLTTCLGLVNMSHEDVEDDMATWYINLIKDILNNLDNILKDLTQITAIRQGGVSSTKINLKKLVDETLSEFSEHSEMKNVSLKNNIKMRGKVSSDTAILRMVFRNLIGNALKYRKKESKNSFLKISASQDTKATSISFRDNGIGVEKNVADSIFNMFFRGTTESNGSGLGLYMVRTGLDKINSSISVKSTPGKGSTFMIKLPKHDY